MSESPALIDYLIILDVLLYSESDQYHHLMDLFVVCVNLYKGTRKCCLLFPDQVVFLVKYLTQELSFFVDNLFNPSFALCILRSISFSYGASNILMVSFSS